jgi:hypothetical protein
MLLKNGFGYILGHVFKNSSGHSAWNDLCKSFLRLFFNEYTIRGQCFEILNIFAKKWSFDSNCSYLGRKDDRYIGF